MRHLVDVNVVVHGMAHAAAQLDHAPVDLVGGPFAVIESDPGVFTSLTRKLGIRGSEFVEVYDIEPWAIDHLHPHGLIFCFLWHKDVHRAIDFEDPSSERVWFANQLIDDACASQAILNVVLNCPGIDIGHDCTRLKQETEDMSPAMKGLAISNCTWVREAHNSLARPADISAARFALAEAALSSNAPTLRKNKQTSSHTAEHQRAKSSRPKKKAKTAVEESTGEETYHFIGYVPAYGKVWELDGLKSGPLEVGELPFPSALGANLHLSTAGWMDVVRPALRMKMKKYGGSAEGGSNIRFSLLALVEDPYLSVSDRFELLKKERGGLERRLGEAFSEGWECMVEASIRDMASSILLPLTPSRIFAQDFGARKMQKDMSILDMPTRNLIPAWEACIRDMVEMQVALQDELAKSARANADHYKRTHNYEPLIREYLTALHSEGILGLLLDKEKDNRKRAVLK